MTLHEKGWSIKPTWKGVQTQHGGPAPRDLYVAFLVYRLADTTNSENFVSYTELIDQDGDEKIITYARALEAQRLGYAEVMLP